MYLLIRQKLRQATGWLNFKPRFKPKLKPSSFENTAKSKSGTLSLTP